MSKSVLTQKSVVMPWECDGMGHLNVRFYAARFDDAGAAFFSTVLAQSGSEVPATLGWADVKQTFDFLKEVRCDDVLEVHSHVGRLGTKSITHVHEMRRVGDGAVVAQVETITSCFDRELRSSIPVPEALRAGFAAHCDSAPQPPLHRP